MPPTTTTICAFCHVAVETGDATACGVCGTRHHVDCWEQNDGCAVALCAGGPALPFIGGAAAGDGGRLRIDLEPEAREPASRHGTYVGVGLAVLVVVIGLIAVIAHGSGTPPAAAGDDAGGKAQQIAPPTAVAGARPLRATTAQTILVEKRRVKRRAVGARRLQRTAIERAKAAQIRRQSAVGTASAGAGASPSATPHIANGPLVPGPRQQPNAGGRKRGGSSGGGGTEKADPLVDNSFNN